MRSRSPGSCRTPATARCSRRSGRRRCCSAPTGRFSRAEARHSISPSSAPATNRGFVISVPVTAPVARYRVGFRGEDGHVIGHVDRRTAATMASGATPLAHRASGQVMNGAQSGHRGGVRRGTRRKATAGQEAQDPQTFRFRTGVELINVTATVTDANGRFVSGLRKEDFRLFEDGQEQQITHFNSERVPVSLGIVVDTSGSMEGEKLGVGAAGPQSVPLPAARSRRRSVPLSLRQPAGADRRLDDGPRADRDAVSARIRPRGGDVAVRRGRVSGAARADRAGTAKRRSSSSRTATTRTAGDDPRDEVDDSLDRSAGVCDRDRHADRSPHGAASRRRRIRRRRGRACRFPLPFPIPGRVSRRRNRRNASAATAPGSSTLARPLDDRLNVAALRDITDESGGRTEIVRFARDVDPATSSVADELSKQVPTWVTRRRGARTASGTRSASSCGTAGISCARARDTWRSPEPAEGPP